MLFPLSEAQCLVYLASEAALVPDETVPCNKHVVPQSWCKAAPGPSIGQGICRCCNFSFLFFFFLLLS